MTNETNSELCTNHCSEIGMKIQWKGKISEFPEPEIALQLSHKIIL